MRDLKPGEKPPMAYQNVWKFPDWWKPYRINYFGHGYFVGALVILFFFGQVYVSDINWMKGRKSRRPYQDDADLLNIAGKL